MLTIGSEVAHAINSVAGMPWLAVAGPACQQSVSRSAVDAYLRSANVRVALTGLAPRRVKVPVAVSVTVIF